MKRLIPAYVVSIALALPLTSAADETITSLLDIAVEDASLAAEDNGAYRLRFRLVNDSPTEIVLTGVESKNATRGELIFHSHHGSSEPIESMPLKPDEEIDFSTSHLQARLIGLTPAGNSVPFTLILANGKISGEAHVH